MTGLTDMSSTGCARSRPARALSALLTVLAVLLGAPLLSPVGSGAGGPGRSGAAQSAAPGMEGPSTAGILPYPSRATSATGTEHHTPHPGTLALPASRRPPHRTERGTAVGRAAGTAYGMPHHEANPGRAPPLPGAL